MFLTCQTLCHRCLQTAGRGTRRGRLCQSANMHQPHHQQRVRCQGKRADILTHILNDCNIFEDVSIMNGVLVCYKSVLLSHESVNVVVIM